MGVGTKLVTVAVVLFIVVMITPTTFAWNSNVEDELKRLDSEYVNENEETVDFEKLRQDEINKIKTEIEDKEKLVITLKNQIDIVDGVILNELKVVEKQKEELRNNWNAPPVDTSVLKSKIQVKEELEIDLKKVLREKKELEDNLKKKELLLEIIQFNAKLVGIELSPNCVKLVILNSTKCPTYEDLLDLDTSNREISGDFSFHDGYFHREKSNWVDSWKYYDTEDTIRVILDPRFELKQRIKMITIEPNLDYYTLGYDKITENGFATLHKDRYIKDCDHALINAAKYLEIIPDTIYTFRNGCEVTKFNESLQYELPKTDPDIANSEAYDYMRWMEEAKERCKVVCK